MKAVPVLFFWLLASSSNLPGQTPRAARTYQATLGNHCLLQLHWDANPPGDLKEVSIIVLTAGPRDRKTELDLGIPYPADCGWSPDLKELFFAGRDGSGNRALCALRSPSPETTPYTVAWSQRLGPGDAVGICYSRTRSRLYLLDAAGLILQASYTPGATRGPANWTVLTSWTEGMVTDLANAGDYGLGLVKDGASPLLALTMECMELHLNRVFIRDSSPLVSYVEESGLKSTARIMVTSLSPGQTAIGICAPTGALVEFLRMDVVPFQVLAQDRIATGKSKGIHSATLTVPGLAWGHVYGLRCTPPGGRPSVEGPFFTPQLRIGQPPIPTPGPGGIAIAPFPGFGLTAHLGNSSFQVPLQVAAGDGGKAAPAAGRISATLHVAAQADPGDPGRHCATLADGRKLLRPRCRFARSLALEPGGWCGKTAINLPIPNDPNLAGGILLCQWIIREGDAYRLSEISGIRIRPAGWMSPAIAAHFTLDGKVPPLARTTSRSANQRPSTGKTGFTAAFAAWLESGSMIGAAAVSTEQTESLIDRINRQARRP